MLLDLVLERLYERVSERFEKIPLKSGRPRKERLVGRPSESPSDHAPDWRVIELSVPDSSENKLLALLEKAMELPPGLFNDLVPRWRGPRPKVPSLMGPTAPLGKSFLVSPPSKDVMLEWVRLVRRRSQTRRRVRRLRHAPQVRPPTRPHP